MDFRITDKIEVKDIEEMFQGLLNYNLPRIEDKNPRESGIYLQDGRGP